MNTGSIESINEGPGVGPLTTALVAFTATDAGTLRRVSLSVNDLGGVQVNMHRHSWPQAVEMLRRLRIDRMPSTVVSIGKTAAAARFERGTDGESAVNGGLTLVWFSDHATIAAVVAELVFGDGLGDPPF